MSNIINNNNNNITNTILTWHSSLMTLYRKGLLLLAVICSSSKLVRVMAFVVGVGLLVEDGHSVGAPHREFSAVRCPRGAAAS